MTPREILIAARALIDTPDKWRQGCNDGSTQLCANEAIWVAAGREQSDEWNAARARLKAVVETDYITGWNDSSPHAAVIAGFDAAIAKAES